MSTQEQAIAAAATAAAATVVTQDPVKGALWGAWEWAIRSSAEDAVALAVQADIERLESSLRH